MEKVFGWPHVLFIENNVWAQLECSIRIGILTDAVVHGCGKSFSRVQSLRARTGYMPMVCWRNAVVEPNLDLR